jgi:DNA replicative helicase MCM subunit Mcm2 (Cdc46/Mcm family)
MNSAPKTNNYEVIVENVKNFLKTYQNEALQKVYYEQIIEIATRQREIIVIDLEDLIKDSSLGELWVKNMKANVLRYRNAFYDAVDCIIEEMNISEVYTFI